MNEGKSSHDVIYLDVKVTPWLHVQIQMGGQGVRTPLKNHKNIGSLSNTGTDPLKNHKSM